jgi:hypothetical protein
MMSMTCEQGDVPGSVYKSYHPEVIAHRLPIASRFTDNPEVRPDLER